MTRQAAAYRAGRVLLAGDSAHVHHPAGGQGLSLGVQDGVNLGWKLARVLDGNRPGGAPRHLPGGAPSGGRPRPAVHDGPDRAPAWGHRVAALVDIVSELVSMDEPRTRLAGMVSGLDIRYELGEGQPPRSSRSALHLVRSGGGMTSIPSPP